MFKTTLFVTALVAMQVNALEAAGQPDGVAQYVAALTNTTLVDHEITLEGAAPSWLVGDYINACPSLFNVGKYELENFIDGFMRFNRYRIEGNKMKFSSKIVDDSAAYTASMKAGEP